MCPGYTESRFGDGGQIKKKYHPFATLLSQQRQKLRKTRILKELKADTAQVCFPGHVFCRSGRGQSRWRSVFPCQRQLTDPLTSFGWRCPVLRTAKGGKQGLPTSHEMIQHLQLRCTDPHLKVKLCRSNRQLADPTHQLAPAKGSTASGICLASLC